MNFLLLVSAPLGILTVTGQLRSRGNDRTGNVFDDLEFLGNSVEGDLGCARESLSDELDG